MPSKSCAPACRRRATPCTSTPAPGARCRRAPPTRCARASTPSRRAAGSAPRLREVPGDPRRRARGARRVRVERPERIALTHSTSGGMNLVLGGMTFAPGDEVVTTDNEHPGLLEPLAALERRYGIVVRVAEALHSADPLDAITALIGPRTKLVALSHVLWANGRVLPMRAISDAAHAVGRPVLADGAQGAGAIDVDPAALGVDAYAGAGPEMAVRPERRRVPVACGRVRGSLRGRRAELLHARLPRRGAAVLAGRAAARRRLAHDVRAGRAGRGGLVPARARGLVGGRRADGRRAGAASRCCPRCRA